MVSKCVNAYNVETLRFTRVGPCGPVFGPCSTLVIDCFESIQINADIEDGEEISQITANGKQCFFVPAPKLDRGFEVVATLQKKYPNLFTMLNQSWQQVIDELGNITGYQHINDVPLQSGVAIEGWEQTSGAVDCSAGATGQWNYFLVPYVTNWSRGDLELGNSAHTEEWTGHTLTGNNWGVGPYDVRLNASTGTPGPLQAPLATNSHFFDEVVTLAPPVASCECQPLSNPDGPALALTTCATGTNTAGVTATATGARPMEINWGDGTAPEVITDMVELTHPYTNDNRYIVAVKYTDGAEEESYLVVTIPCP